MPKSNESWLQKEKREAFLNKVGAFIIKCGPDKDPVLKEVYPIAKEVVDKAFEYYPEIDKPETVEEKNFDFTSKETTYGA